MNEETLDLVKQILINVSQWIVVLIPLCIPSVILLIKEAHRSKNTILVGVPIEYKVPKELDRLHVYTDLRKARRDKTGIAILRTHRLSYALRICDFVITDFKDPKCISPDDTEALTDLVTDFIG